jgi:putative membrane-bound dehydrogenase-like protein
MKHLNTRSIFVLLLALVSSLHAAQLRVTVAGDSDAFKTDFSAALKQAGAEVTTAAQPDAASLAHADVLILQRAKFESLPAAAQQAVTQFAQRGGGIVAVNAAVAGGDVAWGKATFGGAWDAAASAKFMNRMMFSVRPDSHPIVNDAAQFDVDDDTLYDLALDEKISVLASAFTPKVTRAGRQANANRASIYDIQPQAWTFEGAKHRAAVFLPGAPATLKHASVRTFILRAVAWTAKRENVDEFCAKADLATLRYPAGGPLTPLDAIKQFEMQPGFKAGLVAAEPLINKPIAVAWDARGRLWVAETPEYPNGRRPLTAAAWKEGGVLDPGNYTRPARDRICILEDTDGDGMMDRKTVFHEGLELITGFCMHRDGVIVVAQPNIVWLRDTDGDNKADKEEVVFGGFTPGDTHFVANHFIPAPDGWIYASTGSGASATKAGTKEVVGKVSSGVFRFKADGSAIEQVASSGGNTFGAEVTSDMELFHGKATTGNPLQHVVLPEWILARAGSTSAKSMSSINPGRPIVRKDMPDRAPLMQIDQVGRYSAACSSMVYEGGAWPKEYEGLIFVTEPILDIIHHERMVPKGPTLAGELVLQDAEWLRSKDHWFTPIDVTFGPDGAMYVLDFYTPVVAHNDTRGPQHSRSGASVRPDREHYFGRIYRIQHDAAPKLAHPDLTKASAAELVAAFQHPNRVVRFNAIRVLMEKADTLGAQAVPALGAMARSEKFVPARILALWSLQRMGKLTPELFAAAATAAEPAVRKNAMLIAESARRPLSEKEVAAALNDNDARVRLAALRAMTVAPGTAESAAMLMAAQAKFDDAWTKAAAAAAASANPGALLESLLAGNDSREEFARSLAAALVANNDLTGITRVLTSAAKSENTKLATAVVEEIGQRPPAAPADNAAAIAALRSLLTIGDLASSALPLAVAWDKAGVLKAETAKGAAEQLTIARDARKPVDLRSRAARLALMARSANTDVLPGIIALLGLPQPEAYRRELIAALAATGEMSAGRALADSFAGWPMASRSTAFDSLASRAEWAALVLDALETKKFSPGVLGPLQISRLTAHPDAATARRAKELFAKLGTGANPAKDDIIAKFRPAVEQPGNATKGKELYAANCATCHRLAGTGFELGPDLDGIGSHPAAELLMHIVDPNRMVDDEHRTWNITLKDGTQHSALIASENAAVVKIKMAAGVVLDLKTSDIENREKVANSLMPEGLEALGEEGLRDLINYMQSTTLKGGAPSSGAVVSGPPGSGGYVVPVAALRGEMRMLNLSNAFTADTRHGLYASREAARDSLPFVRFGRVMANGVPYDIVNPAGTKNGNNVIVLKGGPAGSFAHSLTQRVEIPVGLASSRLHFLSGVAGWGGGPGRPMPALTATLHFVGGATQVADLRAGREFVDYIARIDAPASQFAEGIVSEHQVRTFAVPVRNGAVIEKLVLESAGNRIAPTVVAITAELGPPSTDVVPAGPAETSSAPPRRAAAPAAAPGPNDPRTLAPTGQKFAEPKQPGTLRVLLAGGGSSHDFPRFFHGMDGDTLRASGGIDTAATPNVEEATALLAQADVIVFSANHGSFGSAKFHAALNKFADAGKGLVLLHPGVWYNWPSSTGYNKRFIGGGAKSHGGGEFAVFNRAAQHPVMRGVPADFKIKDEHYRVIFDDGAPVEVLADTEPEKETKKPYPAVWLVKDAKARMVCISLGHAAEAHGNPAYKTLLVNAVKWAGGK